MKLTASKLLISTGTLALMSQGAPASEHERTIFESFDRVVSRFEFDWEVHPVATEDGYMLNMFRLIGPTSDSKLHARSSARRKAVKQTEYFYPERIRELHEKQQMEREAEEERQRAAERAENELEESDQEEEE